MFIKILIIVSLCVAGTLQDTPFSTCKFGRPPLQLKVEGCNESPCLFVRGEDVKAESDFNVVADTPDLKPVVIVRVLGIDVNYPLPEQNACNSLSNGECPLDEGETVTYALMMPILSQYPTVSLHLIFSLVDSNDNIHMCFELDARVVN